MHSKLTTEYVWRPWKRSIVLRAIVICFLLAAAITIGFVSYFTLAGFETDKANSSFTSTANYVIDALQGDFVAKENGVLSMVKNMAYLKSNASEWPNVVMPGFYDSNSALKRVASFSEIMFMPLVLPEKLPDFEPFLREYFIEEPNIPTINNVTVAQVYHGVYGIDAEHHTYHDTTGVPSSYSSPNAILAPVTQFFFSEFFGTQFLALNMHSIRQFGPAIDTIIECSKHINYTEAGSCVDITAITKLPINAPDAEVTHIHSVILHPIFLDKNTSQLAGFMGGGFDWLDLLSPLFATSKSGIDVVIENSGILATFTSKEGGGLVYRGLGDSHSARHNKQEVCAPLFQNIRNQTDYDSTYFIRMYPTETYVNHYITKTPIIVCVVLAVFVLLCVAAFVAYDALMRRASAAKAAVLETKRRFVRFISHEIRTPLNAVHLGLEALTSEVRKIIEHAIDPAHPLDPMELLETLRSWLELSSEMMGNSESAVDVLNDLLNYDKIEMGTLRLEFSSVAIWSIMQSVTVSFLTPAKQKNIHISLENNLADEAGDYEEQCRDIFVVVGDSARLAQVMRNLISNAIKFTPEKGNIAIHVERVEDGLPHPPLVVPAESEELLEQPRAGSIRISVTDSGAGLSAAQLSQICSEGVQFNANELQAGKGSGLGLFISKGIVEQHGGKLTVTSAGIGMGTTFTIELPLFHHVRKYVLPRVFSKQRQVSPESSSCESAAHDSITRAGSETCMIEDLEDSHEHEHERRPHTILPKRILVVDDASSNRKMLIRILTSNGYVCEQAEDGQQGIDRYLASLRADTHFDAIIMDFEMPVMNGPTATKALRDMGCTVPVLGVTGNLLPEDIKYFKTHGANEVFGKPLNLARFEEFMRECEPWKLSGGSQCSSQSNSQSNPHSHQSHSQAQSHSQSYAEGHRPPRGKSIDSKLSNGSIGGSGAYSFTLSADSGDLSGFDLV